ncbi:Lrp/AsnC family transcriptional regulator [Nocardioides albidus]|uniref:Lrp/AsnC family transcriptional regulator n=1 Tax=Nocardioides albidus TaxID=1517589 RepID=A0A5C4VL44_9ACTN|nr:Lrp/AsnC family transcriptional regulator [Nocardioides albidus]TNM36522.1 Lrp/AsnC family transcriptional regulator [Nocardioides albidus]
MHESLTEDDIALIHALQVRPRASWTQLSEVLGVSVSTLSRRWDRLTEERLAWVTAFPTWDPDSAMVVALIEVDCLAHATTTVCAALARDSRIITIEQAASGRDLVLTVIARSFTELSELVVDELPTVEGIVSLRTHLIADLHVEGSAWRLDALDRAQLRALARIPGPTGGPGQPDLPGIPESLEPLVQALSRNGRASAGELAEELGRPASTVRRQLAWLVGTGKLNFRCEVAQTQTRWSVLAEWWCQVPEEDRPRLVQALRSQPMVRMAASLAGVTNFILTMWAHSPEEVLTIQRWLQRQVPSIRITDAAVIMRNPKRMGWMLEPDGRAAGPVVPIWPERRAL